MDTVKFKDILIDMDAIREQDALMGPGELQGPWAHRRALLAYADTLRTERDALEEQKRTSAVFLSCAIKERNEARERLAEVEAERTGTIHESWQHKTHAEVLEGLKWQGAITKSLLAANDKLQSRLAALEHPTRPTGKQFWIDRLKGQEAITDRLAARLTEADALIDGLCDHEGAEGWSADLQDRLDKFREERKP